MDIETDSGSDNRAFDGDSSYTEEDPGRCPSPSFSLATLGLQRVGAAPPPRPQPQQPIQTLNARGMPARIRKRNPLFFDDNIINDDKPLRMSLSPRKAAMKIQAQMKSHTNKKKHKRMKNISERMLRSQDKMLRRTKHYKKRNRSEADSTSTTRGNSVRRISTPKSSSNHRNTTPSVFESGNSADDLPNDQSIGERIGMRLRNLLKLPKAHRWVIYEWFSSFIDRPLYDGKSDFEIYKALKFPHLESRHLTRAEWRYIRGTMGKPRRCSAVFFDEERREMERKRQKMRYIQTQRICDIKNTELFNDVPDKIPLPLPLGTKVTCLLREPQNDIFNGTVDAYDSLNSKYRVAFDRAGLGTVPVHDYEISSEDFNEMISLQSIKKDIVRTQWPENQASGGATGGTGELTVSKCSPILFGHPNNNRSDPLLGQPEDAYDASSLEGDLEKQKEYPVHLLETIVRLKKALTVKKIKLHRLYHMNNEAELDVSKQLMPARRSSAVPTSDNDNSQQTVVKPKMSEDFQRRYASVIISMENVNRDIQNYLNEVQAFASELTGDPQIQAMLHPSYLREKCREMADEAVMRNNRGLVKNKVIIKLIKNLATVLLVASHLNSDNTTEVTKVLEGCVEEVRSSVHENNMDTFQKHVETHLEHIQLGIGQNFQAILDESQNSAGPDADASAYNTAVSVHSTSLSSNNATL